MKDLFIIGAGGYGREVMDMVLDIQDMDETTQWRLKGFLTDIKGDFYDKDTLQYDIVDGILQHKVRKNAVYVFAVSDIAFKKRVTKDYLNQGAEFVNIIHPSCVLSRTVEMGIGNIISYRTNINSNVKIGNFIRIGSSCALGHDVKIGDYGVVNAMCSIGGYASIKEEAFIGSSAVICPHAQVGIGAKVGAGAVVLKKVKSNTTVFGNPAKKIDL